MFDFTNSSFSSLITIFSAIIGLAYPVLLQSIQRIDEQYNSTRLSYRFQEEVVFNLFQFFLFSNIIISVLFPFILYISNINWTVNCVILQTISISALLFTSFHLFRVIRKYYYPKHLFEKLVFSLNKKKSSMMEILNKKDDNKLVKELLNLLDLSIYAARKTDQDIYYGSISEIYDFVLEYQRNIEKDKYVVYPKGFMKIFLKIRTYSTDENNQTYFYKQNDITSILLNSPKEHRISPPTYMFLWLTINDVIASNNEGWFNQYWSIVNQQYSLSFHNLYPEDSSSQNELDKKRFYEQHIMLGALLVYNNKYKWLNNMMFFTNEMPPHYNLIPGTLVKIFDQLKYFYDFSFHSVNIFLSSKYPFIGMNADVNTDYYIFNEIKRYFSLLVIRLFLVNDYNINYSNPMDLPKIGTNVAENKANIKLAQQLIEGVNQWYEEKDKIYFDYIPKQEDVINLLKSYINLSDNDINSVKQNPEIDPQKIKKLKNNLFAHEQKSTKDIITSQNIKTQLKLEPNQTLKSKELPILYKNKLQEEEILKGYSLYSFNLEEVLIQILFDYIQRYYINYFISQKSINDYTIAYEDIFKAFDRLDLDSNKHIILSQGVYLGNFEEQYGKQNNFIYNSNTGVFSYNNVNIINIPSQESSILILKISDLPYYEFSEIDDKGLAKINKDSFLYSNLDSINPNDCILKLKYKLKFYSNSNLNFIRLKVSNNLPLGSNGDLDIIEKFDKVMNK